MNKKVLINNIKEIISDGKTLEACDNLGLILKKDSDKYDIYVMFRNQLKRLNDQSLLNIISKDVKEAHLNDLNLRLLKFIASLEHGDFHDFILSGHSKEEILSELIQKNEEFEFTINQLKAVYNRRIEDKNATIKSLIKRHRAKRIEWYNKINQLETVNIELTEAIQSEKVEKSKLAKKVEDLNNEILRLKKIALEVYAARRIWR